MSSSAVPSRGRRSKAQLGDAALFVRIAELKASAMGREGDMPAGIVAAFRRVGFLWGGEWSGANRDPMHFHYCTGY